MNQENQENLLRTSVCFIVLNIIKYLFIFPERFGSQKIDDELIQRFEKVTGKKGKYFKSTSVLL